MDDYTREVMSTLEEDQTLATHRPNEFELIKHDDIYAEIQGN